MRCLVLYRYVLCLVTFFKSLNTQEQEKVFENNNNKKQTVFYLASKDFSSCMAFNIDEVVRLACLSLGA